MMAQEARDELFDYFQEEEKEHRPISARAYISGNLAQELEEEPWEEEKFEEAPKKKPVKKQKVKTRQVPLWKRVLILGGVLVIAGGLLRVAMSYSELYTARQELYNMQARLTEEEQNTAVLENEGTADMGLSDLYSYAVGHLGMKEASGNDITEMGPLETDYTVQETQETQRKATQVNFHLFGGND